ncbi:thioesterase family protein [Pilimelia terevasa]|uniref:thioesterase family protein n=1 Tax=Pilimelia terevasa TaxID=53372 RepID=UPI001E65713B|nr:hotdog domain-containing protein [Pilimelia terevasa]
MRARVGLTVSDRDTAQAVGSGDVPVLGTPQLLALAETASVAATARRLPSGMTTVGAVVSVEHLAPTPVGRTVSALASLTGVRGRRLYFDVSVTDGATVVARGRIERVLVDRRSFVAGAFADR